MLVPTKGIGPERALLTVGASLLSLLDSSPTTVSGLWERFSRDAKATHNPGMITFDWFAMALSMLFTLSAVTWNTSGQLERCHVSA